MNALVRLSRPVETLDLDTFARAAGLHPDLVRRLVALGLLEAAPTPGGDCASPLRNSPPRRDCDVCVRDSR